MTIMTRKRSVADQLEPGNVLVKKSSSECLASPRKRPRYSFPQTPVASGSAPTPYSKLAAGSSSPDKLFETPRTPYTPYPLRASDSPSNPFGRKRTKRLLQTLPEVTSFKRHIPLRFQFVRKDIHARQGGVFRVVRVPMNYTFAHLRCLIAWLFDTPVHNADGKSGLWDAEDYLFEVKAKSGVYSPLYKPGQVKGGVTTVKLSNVRDPARWSFSYGDSGEDELSESEDETMADGESQVDAEEEDWTWVDEEDYTLAHAWRTGLDPTIGIIYYHSHSTQVHITVNTTKIPIFRGSSNTPEVLTARGRVHLSPPPLPRPKFTRSILDIFSSSPAPVPPPKSKPISKKRCVRLKSPTPPPRLASHRKPKFKSPPPPVKVEDLDDADAEGESDQEEDTLQAFDSTHPFFHSSRSPPKRRNDTPEVILVEDSDDEDLMEEDINKVVHEETWNIPKHSFGLYLLRFMDPLGGPYDDIDASFFEKEKVFDPFENDNDPIVEPRKRAVAEEEDDDIGDEDEEEEDDDIDEEEDEEEEADGEADEEQEELHEDDDDDEEEDELDDNPTAQDPHLESTPDLSTNCVSSSSSSLPPSSPSAGPGLGILSSPSLYSHSFANSSSNSFSSSSAYSDYTIGGGAHSDSIIILEEHYPNKKYAFTPAPPKKRKHRLRIKRLEKRLAKMKKSEFLCKHDEVEEMKKLKKKVEVEVEVDELVDEEDAKWVKPELKEGEVWDPFGDEPEL